MTSLSKLAFALLLAFFPALAFSQSASDLFTRGKTRAKAEQKNVLLVFSASWCGPCKLYERFLEDPQMSSITEKALVVVRVDMGERPRDPAHADTPDGLALRTELGAAGEPGFPFLVITDENGSPIVNSYRNGNAEANVGYPAAPEEIDWYVEMLKRAAPALLPEDLAATRVWLRKHAPH